MNINSKDDDAITFAKSIKNNIHLESLVLTSNNITNPKSQILVIKHLLVKAIFDPPSLNTVAGCNHTCQILPEDINMGDFEMTTIIDSSNLKFKKKLKMFLSLAAPNKECVNLSLLGYISSNAVTPSLLDFIQQYQVKRY